MVRNGLTATDEELATIMQYLSNTYVQEEVAQTAPTVHTPPATDEASRTNAEDDNYY
jgi:hypothetical protein